jgi:glycine cleavage system H protein
METFNNLYFSKEHTWIKIENETGTVGLLLLPKGSLAK